MQGRDMYPGYKLKEKSLFYLFEPLAYISSEQCDGLSSLTPSLSLL